MADLVKCKSNHSYYSHHAGLSASRCDLPSLRWRYKQLLSEAIPMLKVQAVAL